MEVNGQTEVGDLGGHERWVLGREGGEGGVVGLGFVVGEERRGPSLQAATW
jgi:hypothetical protein